jgi:hypothetical protein
LINPKKPIPQSPQNGTSTEDEEVNWIEKTTTIKAILYGLFIICIALFLADAFYHKHSVFEAQSWFGFYAVFGFFMCIGLVLAAKFLRLFLMRDEDYYDGDK